MTKGAATTDEYLARLPADRRAALTKMRAIIRNNLPPGYQEGTIWDSMVWFIPLSRYANTHNGKPLGVIGLASHARYMSLYLMAVYGDPELREWFEQAFRKSGKKLDMGKSCVRFESLDELPLDVIAKTVARVSVERYLAQYERARAGTVAGKRVAKKVAAAKKTPAAKKKPAAKKPAAKKPAAKKPAAKKPAAKKRR